MVSEKEVHALAEVLLGRVNAPEQEIYRASRDGLEAAALAREANAEGGEPVEVKPLANLIHDALAFAVWAAGEGLYPTDGPPAPEDFLYAYSAATGFEDWDAIPHHGATTLSALTAGKPEQVAGEQPIETARPLDEWHEDFGAVVWWAQAEGGWIAEAAWIGTPNRSDWPGYHTHWTPHPKFPAFPTAGGGDA